MKYQQYYDDPDTVLKEYDAKVVINDRVVDSEGVFSPCEPTWNLTWKHGCIELGFVEYLSEHWAKVQAALFCYLWSSGIDAGVAKYISCGYATCYQWFSGPQKVYQLQAIGLDVEGERVIFSERLWYSYKAAEDCKEDFIKTATKKGLMYVSEVNVLTLELRQ